MAFIKRLRNQNWLFPLTIADLIEEDHICRLVDDVVESIDFKSIEEKYDGPSSPHVCSVKYLFMAHKTKRKDYHTKSILWTPINAD